jgi:hypothetical protein
MAQLNVTELDFFGIRENLKTYLQSQTEFADYNFDGSGLSVLIDILAYNTHYNATLAHLLANEMFIDSAVKRSSVVSISKSLGYNPRSIRSARVDATITITPPPSYTSSVATISKNIGFRGVGSDGVTYTFYPEDDITAIKADGTFTFVATLVEGVRTNNFFTVTADTESGPFELLNTNVDTSTVTCKVQTSTSELEMQTFVQELNIVSLTGTTRAFFVEENANALVEVRFGDNVLGKKLTTGNIVTIDYLVSGGAGANGITTLTAKSVILGTGETISVSSAASYGGAAAQTTDSIRYIAPKFNATKNRAVTAEDYMALIESQYANINSITVWGGEDNDPPIYGKVFVSIEPLPNSVITESDKTSIARDILKPRGVVGIQPVFVDPSYLYISLNITARYLKNNTSVSASVIQNTMSEYLASYFVNTTSKVKKNFYYSELLELLNSVSTSIYATNIEMNLHRAYEPFTAENNRISFAYNTTITPNSVRSNLFTTILPSGKEVTCYLRDSYTEDDSLPGVLDLYDDTNVLISTAVGTIEYQTGKILIPSLYINTISGTDFYLRIYIKPQGSSPDIIMAPVNEDISYTYAVTAYANKNLVLAQDTSTISGTGNYITGTTINIIGT